MWSCQETFNRELKWKKTQIPVIFSLKITIKWAFSLFVPGSRQYVLWSDRKLKIPEVLLTFMHIYIIIFKQSGLYYSQFIFKIQFSPLQVAKRVKCQRYVQTFHSLVHSFLKRKKKKRKKKKVNKSPNSRWTRTDRSHTLVRCHRIRTSASEMCPWVSIRRCSGTKRERKKQNISAQEQHRVIFPTGVDLTCRPWTDERSVRGRERKAAGLSFPSCRPDTPHQWIDRVLHISSTRSMVRSLQHGGHKQAARNSVI